ncbi:CASP8 and FADD-like apoptosis regulator, partial [Protobothrops mucrosquamatus]|uniref:CASP8 and FADD-like apoptosis regulator n=1 Tax=Protobothrops mucrosquamatus TaxID=103944 RepID=UPI0010FB6A95
LVSQRPFGVPKTFGVPKGACRIEETQSRAKRALELDLVSDVSTPGGLQLLTALNEKEKLTTINLSELLYRLKRFDLLKKFLGTGRAAVEASLAKHPQMLSKYRDFSSSEN